MPFELPNRPSYDVSYCRWLKSIFISLSDVVGTARSKEEYLFKGCAARVRGYLAKGQVQLKEEVISVFITELRTLLLFLYC
jgi:hypothetical protein